MDINTRLDRIISDPVFTRNLTLLRYFSNRFICPLVDTVLDRFCSQTLLQIHYKIDWLNLESLSMERILLAAADYPNLHNLGLYNVDKKTAESVFAGGLFKCVYEVSLFDDRPFEHEFFVRIAQAFPLLKKLSMINRTPQNQRTKNNNEYLSIIEYLHLIELDFLDVNDDYLE
ncbi:unnamed protein product [Rotaria sp. Silwood2]|nr:unnamed protein product [Rotaria sp. Silwood2]CAF3118251.1 unnamed protein product [Rotaria sp. Silwood2]CAF3394965.1 unnamed protein product [Rotaria sp. Silwood2]CAF4388151.1 unnamed protein product [Rotaria sp. Silwood2]CAF4488810.1 unnamed protein product [Rotaria sp. Silwood2]